MAIQITKRPYKKCLSGNPIHYELYSQLAVDNPANVFEVRILFRPIGGAYAEVTTAPINPVAGYASLDVKDYISSMLEYEVPPIQDDPLEVFSSIKQSGYFYIEYREVTAANPNPSWDSSEAGFERFVLKAEIDYMPYRGNNFWVNYFEVEKPFLTWQLKGRLAAAGERIYLAWLNDTDADPAAIRAVVRSYRTDGSLIQEQTLAAPVEKGTVGYIPAGCTQWSLQADPLEPLYYWTVQVQDRTNPLAPVALSEAFRLELDNKYDGGAQTLVFRNSLGGLDSARLRGIVEKKLSYQFTEVEKTVAPNYFDGAYVSPRKGVTGKKEILTYSANLGQFRREEQDRHRDLQHAEEAWLEVRGKWWPVVILTQSFTLTKSDDTRWHMPIEYAFADGGSTAYTPQSVDLGDGVFNDNVCKARLTDIVISQAVAPGLSEVTINATEVDPQNASTQFRYRIYKSVDLSVVVDWTTITYDQLPVSHELPTEATYMLELQSICINDVYGQVTSSLIDTRSSAPPPPPPGANSIFSNSTPSFFEYIISYPGTAEPSVSGHMASYGTNTFNIAGGQLYPSIVVSTSGFSPSSAKLTVGGVEYTGAISGLEITFTNVNVPAGNGIQIQFY